MRKEYCDYCIYEYDDEKDFCYSLLKSDCFDAIENMRKAQRKPTYFEQFKAMSVEQMASAIYINAYDHCKYCKHKDSRSCYNSNAQRCIEGIKQHLESEVE